MATESEKKVALALLSEVEMRVSEVLGNHVAMPFDVDNYDAGRDVFCENMVKQCDLAEKKASDDTEVLFKSYFLKAQLYGCWQKPQGVRGTHNKAKECYEKMLQIGANMGGDASMIHYRYALFCRVSPMGGKQKAIENFKRVIELVGEDSELGVECAKELAKEEDKKGGCFIATACLGSDSTDEVITLSEFRDNVLQRYSLGRKFIKIYYHISPPIAKVIAESSVLKKLLRILIITPSVIFARLFISLNSIEKE